MANTPLVKATCCGRRDANVVTQRQLSSQELSNAIVASRMCIDEPGFRANGFLFKGMQLPIRDFSQQRTLVVAAGVANIRSVSFDAAVIQLSTII